MREFLKGLELDKETIDTIMAEHGKLITESKEEVNNLKSKVTEYESKISELSSKTEENSKIKEELDTLKKSIAEKDEAQKLQKQDEILTNNISAVFKDKEFVNEYTKKSIISEIKTAMKDEKNAGKSAKDLFDEITNGKEGLFKNPNPQINMGGNKPIDTEITKEAFNKMSYTKRIELKQENPTLFEQLNNE